MQVIRILTNWILENTISADRVLANARKYIATLPGVVRLFVGQGGGFGDQVMLVNVMKHLQWLGYKGEFQIIGHAWSNHAQSPLLKTMQLLNVDNDTTLFSQTLATTLDDGMQVTFIEYLHFAKNKMQFEKVELGIFAGMINFGAEDFGWLKNDSYRMQPTTLMHAKKVLFFDPFSRWLSTSHISGFSLQLEKQVFRFYLDILLPYRIHLANETTIRQALHKLAKRNLSLTNFVTALRTSETANKINIFSIYGLNPIIHPQPEYKMLIFILSAIKAHLLKHREKQMPLEILIFNTISDESWQKLQTLFSINANTSPLLKKALQSLATPIQFFDISQLSSTANITDFNITSSLQIRVSRMTSLPRDLFNDLYLRSELPPIYEGANTASLLLNQGRFGIPCKRADWGNNPSSEGHNVLPARLEAVGQYVCQDVGMNDWQKQPTPDEVLVPTMLQFTRDQKNVTRLEISTDRVSYALDELSKKPTCSESPAVCAFFQPQKNGWPVAMLIGATVGKSALYGVIGETSKFMLIEKFKTDRNIAIPLSHLLRYAAHSALDGVDAMILIILLFNTFLDYAFEKKMKYVKATVQAGVQAGAYFIQFFQQAIKRDTATNMLIIGLVIAAVLIEFLARYVTRLVFGTEQRREMRNTARPSAAVATETARSEGETQSTPISAARMKMAT